MKFRFLIVFFLFINSAQAQKTGTAFIDSIQQLINVAKEDTNKAMLIYRLGQIYSANDPDKGMTYARTGLALTQKLGWKTGIGTNYYLIGTIFMNKGVYDSAIVYYKKSYDLDLEAGDKHGLAADFINMGLMEATRGDAVKSTGYLMQALPLATEVRDTNYISLIYNNLSNIYLFQKDYKKAGASATTALSIARAGNKEDNIAGSLAQLGAIAHEQRDTVHAMKYYEAALLIYQKLESVQRIAGLLGNIGILQKNKRQAIEFKLQAQVIWDTISPLYPDAIKNTGNLGVDYLDLVRADSIYHINPGGIIPAARAALLERAEHYLQLAVDRSKEADNKEWLWLYAGELSALFQQKGDYKRAFEYLQQSKEVHDSLYSQDIKNQIANITGDREIAIRDKQIEVNKLSLEAQRKQRFALIGGIVLLMTIGLLLIIQNRNRRRNNEKLQHLNTKLDEANKVKAKFFAILSHDLRSPIANLIGFLDIKKEAPEMLTLESAANHEQQITSSASALLGNMEAMLLWSKDQMQNFKPQFRTVTVDALFDHQRIFFANAANINFEFDNVDLLSLNTDENYLQTIMQNLTANAVNAVKGKADATVRWRAFQQNGKTIMTVADNGDGISADKIPALNDSKDAVNGSTGFGMHLIRDLAKAINILVTVSSTAGEGTIFSLEQG